ncbi:hypothetical protein CTAYLR_007691 [Chrysophaeum taylorii]|uniref:alpha-1,2-Mannosidase n=1 Tax=Chrysophaeum taylorii TaxID=2483200 RepID=A0AAD7U8D1_9STRA|nr:hypothetical protein CTAYLR_007691 [Chrysophaeum taylorii]
MRRSRGSLDGEGDDKSVRSERRRETSGLAVLPLVAAVFMFGVLVGSTMGNDPHVAPVESPMRRSLRGDAASLRPRPSSPQVQALVETKGALVETKGLWESSAEFATRRVQSFESKLDGATFAESTVAGALDAADVTVAAWVYLDGRDRSPTIKTIASNRATGCDASLERDGYALAINEWETADGQLTLEWGDGDTGCRKLGSGAARVPYDAWTHVAATLSAGGAAALYVDARLAARTAGVARRSPQAAASLRVGQYVDGLYPFVGNVSALAVVGAALEPEAVSRLARHTAPGQVDVAALAREVVADSLLLGVFELETTTTSSPPSSTTEVVVLADARGRERSVALAYHAPPPPPPPGRGYGFFALPEASSSSDASEAEATARTRAAAVKAAMQHAWAGYKAYAWGRDELKPASKRGHDNWGGMGVTLVDSLDTLWLMGMRAEFDEAKEWVRSSLAFDRTGEVSVFETTIRELGGLLAAFDLSGDQLFLDKADDLGRRLAGAFDTPSGVPRGSLDLREGRGRDVAWTSGNAVLAELGSLQIEFRYLAAKTGNPEYARKANRVFEVAVDLRPPDGLYPIYLSPTSGRIAGRKITFGALGDSFYEYLLKTWLQGGRVETRLRETYDAAIDGMVRKLLQRSEPSGLAYVADLDGGLVKKMDHLVCFLPGTMALGAYTDPRGLDSPRARRDLEIAKALAHTCFEMYDRMPSKLAPEFVSFRAGADFVPAASAPFYILRPETAESLFVLHHLTRDPLYRDRSWKIFEAINAHCKTAAGFGSIPDVRQTRGRPPDDRMESFFLAETLKYLFLIQQPDNGIDLLDLVFNTEAHPLRILGDSGIHLSDRLKKKSR